MLLRKCVLLFVVVQESDALWGWLSDVAAFTWTGLFILSEMEWIRRKICRQRRSFHRGQGSFTEQTYILTKVITYMSSLLPVCVEVTNCLLLRCRVKPVVFAGSALLFWLELSVFSVSRLTFGGFSLARNFLNARRLEEWRNGEQVSAGMYSIRVSKENG